MANISSNYINIEISQSCLLVKHKKKTKQRLRLECQECVDSISISYFFPDIEVDSQLTTKKFSSCNIQPLPSSINCINVQERNLLKIYRVLIFRLGSIDPMTWFNYH